MPDAKRRTPFVVMRGLGTAPMVAEDREQAVTALAALIHEWWSSDRCRSADAVCGSDQSGDAAAD
jgi:hypothetical protein